MAESFSATYEADIEAGRPSIATEKLMRAILLQVLYGVRSKRELVEPLAYRDRSIEHVAVMDQLIAT